MSEPAPTRASPWLLWLPLLAFAAFLALVAYGLRNPAPREVRSALIGKPVPEFNLPPALDGQPGLARADLADGKVKLVNIFASWCVPCAVEAPQLAALKAAGVNLVGVAIRDKPADLKIFLDRNGNPFSRIAADNVSAIQFQLGSSGVPESFVVDGRGVIRYQHIGEIRADQVPLILAEIERAAGCCGASLGRWDHASSALRLYPAGKSGAGGKREGLDGNAALPAMPGPVDR